MRLLGIRANSRLYMSPGDADGWTPLIVNGDIRKIAVAPVRHLSSGESSEANALISKEI